MKKFLLSLLRTPVALISYLVIIKDLFTGLAFLLTTPWSLGTQGDMLYVTQPEWVSRGWGLFMVAFSGALLYGMIARARRVVMIGSIALFMLYCYPAILYLIQTHLFVHLPYIIVTTLIYAYLYLAASLDRLWNYFPDLDREWFELSGELDTHDIP